MQHVIHEALPHALDDRGQPDEELIAMEQRFAQENNAATRSGISRNMMTKEVYLLNAIRQLIQSFLGK